MHDTDAIFWEHALANVITICKLVILNVFCRYRYRTIIQQKLVLQFFLNNCRVSHPGSGSDQTIASVRQVLALAMLYIGRLVTCSIDCSFTPKTNFFFLHKKTQHMRVLGIEGKLYL